MGQQHAASRRSPASRIGALPEQFLRVSLVCALAALTVSAVMAPAVMAEDGIDLTLEHGTGPGEVHLRWTGGVIPYTVYRSGDLQRLLEPASQLGQTDMNAWSDFPPPVDPIDFYIVTNPGVVCPPGQTLCPAGCVDLTSDPNNCGSCGVACGDASGCTNDLCVSSQCRNVDVSTCLYLDPNNTAPVDPARCGPNGCGACNFATSVPGCGSIDSDQDGLGDAWENTGWIDLDCDGNLDPNDVQLTGANSRVKDVYLRMSAMANSPEETIPDFHIPSEEAVRRIVAAFGGSHLTTTPVRCDATTSSCPAGSSCSVEDFVCLPDCTTDTSCIAGVCEGGMCRLRRLHFDRAAINIVPHTKVVSLGPVQAACITGGDTAQGVNFYDIKADPVNFDAKESLFKRYGLFGHFNTCDSTSTCADEGCVGIDGTIPAAGNSGLAEVRGNDFVVTLGEAPFAFSPTEKLLHEAGATMHELGHNLGLLHGGPDCDWPTDPSCTADPNQPRKPNYLSVMNYLYSAGIPVTDSPGSVAPSPDPAKRRIDFSHLALPTLDEVCLDEAQGVAPGNPPAYATDLIQFYDPNGAIRFGSTLSGQPIDWNGNSFPFESCVSVNINGWPAGGAPESHPGAEDWSSLTYAFQCHAPFADGAKLLTGAVKGEDTIEITAGSCADVTAPREKEQD